MRLQNIDSQIQKILDRTREIEKTLSDMSELNASAMQLSAAEKSLAESQKDLRLCENLVRDQRIKIEQTDNALYGGKVRNPKELQDLQNEAAALRRYVSVLEDRQLEAMMSLEEAEAQHQLAIDNYERIKTRQQQRDANLAAENSRLNLDLKRLRVERDVVLQTINHDDLDTYENLRNSRRGLAVATIVDQTCGACGSTLTPAVRQSAQSPSQITQCPSCRRILYSG